MVKDDRVKLVKVQNLMNVANSLTKVVSTEKFKWGSNSIHLMAPSNLIIMLIFPFMLQGVGQVGEC